MEEARSWGIHGEGHVLGKLPLLLSQAVLKIVRQLAAVLGTAFECPRKGPFKIETTSGSEVISRNIAHLPGW